MVVQHRWSLNTGQQWYKKLLLEFFVPLLPCIKQPPDTKTSIFIIIFIGFREVLLYMY